MPELPEVETIKTALQQNVINKTISQIKLSDKNLRFAYPLNFNQDLTNSTIKNINRRARYLLIELDNGKTLIIHLGMSGKLNYFNKYPINPQKHDHISIKFDDNSSLIYNDVRRFGFADLTNSKDINNHKMIKNLGPEPLSDNFNSKYLGNILKNKIMNIKTAMMDNKIVVGVGNIYINESLFISKISPLRNSNSLKGNEIEILIQNIKLTLTRAIGSGGSSLKDYVNLNGDIGKFQFDFKVYARYNEKCTICHNIITRIKQNGRSTFYCKKCQN